MIMSLVLKKMIIIVELLILAFFILGEVGFFHCIDYIFLSVRVFSF